MPAEPRQPRRPAAGFAALLLLGLLLAGALIGLTVAWEHRMTLSKATQAAAAPASRPLSPPTVNGDGMADADAPAPGRPDGMPDPGNAQENVETGDGEGFSPETQPALHVSMKDCQWLYDNPLKECARQGDGACKTAEQDFPAAVARGVAALSTKPGFSAGGFHNACLMACITHAKPAFPEYTQQVCGIS